jgi:sugar O-acyltransferase (sialic acid O-acetyltransferase NeuD family)
MTDILVVGGGGHARVLIGVLRSMPAYRVRGYVALEDSGPLLGVPFLGNDEILEELSRERPQAAVALGIGQLDCGEKREAMRTELDRWGFPMPPVVSPNAILRDSQIGEGTFVGDGVVVNPGSRVGECCILNTHAVVEHDCSIGELVHIAPGATLGGGVTVGARSLIGLGANVLNQVSIAGGTIVGAGATVVRDIVEPGVYVGCPARKVK